MQVVSANTPPEKTNFVWGENGEKVSQIPNEKDKSYPYLGIKLHYKMKWDETITSNTQKAHTAHNSCDKMYKDGFIDPDIKMLFFRMKEISSNKYAIELIKHTQNDISECDKYEMKHLKKALNLKQSNHNSLIRLMTGEYDYETIKTTRTINLLRKLRKQPIEKLPPQIIKNWETNKKTSQTNCGQIWTKHRSDILNLTKQETKTKHFENTQRKLREKLKNTKKLHISVRNYVPAKNFKKDPIIGKITSNELSTWINIINE